jgi:hypothetical protein
MNRSRTTVAAALLFCLAAAPTFAEDKPAAKSPAAEPVDYKKLKELLPSELAGIKRSESNGQKIKTGDFHMTMATASYSKDSGGDNPPSAELIITDYGASPSMGEGMAAWSKADLDQDSDDQHQYTLKVAGNPALLTYDKKGKSAQVMVWVANRYFVQVSTTNIDEEQSKKAAESLPYDKLKALK